MFKWEKTIIIKPEPISTARCWRCGKGIWEQTSFAYWPETTRPSLRAITAVKKLLVCALNARDLSVTRVLTRTNAERKWSCLWSILHEWASAGTEARILWIIGLHDGSKLFLRKPLIRFNNILLEPKYYSSFAWVDRKISFLATFVPGVHVPIPWANIPKIEKYLISIAS